MRLQNEEIRWGRCFYFLEAVVSFTHKLKIFSKRHSTPTVTLSWLPSKRRSSRHYLLKVPAVMTTVGMNVWAPCALLFCFGKSFSLTCFLNVNAESCERMSFFFFFFSPLSSVLMVFWSIHSALVLYWPWCLEWRTILSTKVYSWHVMIHYEIAYNAPTWLLGTTKYSNVYSRSPCSPF